MGDHAVINRLVMTMGTKHWPPGAGLGEAPLRNEKFPELYIFTICVLTKQMVLLGTQEFDL